MKTIELEVIKFKVETHMGVKDISNPTRKRDFVVARYMYFHFATIYTNKSYENIARLVNRNHSSVNNGLKELDGYINDYNHYNKVFNRLKLIFSGKSYEGDILESDKLRDVILKLEREIFNLQETNLKPYLMPIVQTLNKIPEDQFEIVQTRVEAIVKMLPKPNQIHS
jgi:hypothetical protein